MGRQDRGKLDSGGVWQPAIGCYLMYGGTSLRKRSLCTMAGVAMLITLGCVSGAGVAGSASKDELRELMQQANSFNKPQVPFRSPFSTSYAYQN